MKHQIRIASPCSADWSQMAGDERVRYCPECKLNVYNFSALTDAEVEEIVARREGRLCARFYRRPDGTLLTKNCPVGFRGALWRASGFASAALAAVVSVGPAAAAQQKKDSQLVQIQAAETGLDLQVVDPAGAVITRAHVRLTNEFTGKAFTGETDESGELRLSDLPDGSYEVSVSSPGFATLRQTHLVLPKRHTVRLDLALAIMGEVVVVRVDQDHWPISTDLSEPPSPGSSQSSPPAQRKNAFRKLLSGLRRIF